MSPTLFFNYGNNIFQIALNGFTASNQINGDVNNNVDSANDTVLITNSFNDIQQILNTSMVVSEIPQQTQVPTVNDQKSNESKKSKNGIETFRYRFIKMKPFLSVEVDV